MTPQTQPETSRQSFSQKGYDHLMGQILSGAFQPGDEINRRKLAEELGVSLAPINEAVSQLESEGFLEVSPRRQTRVRVIRKDEVRGLLILREAIECQAARLYCGKPVVQNQEVLLDLARAIDASEVGTKENEFAECAFHEALVALVESPLLSTEFMKIMRRKLFHKINLVVPWTVQPPLDSHETLLRKLMVEDSDAAEAAMRLHLERGREAILGGAPPR